MNKLAFGAALAALTVALPGAADAQRNNRGQAASASILIVDLGRVLSECNACKAASTQLNQQLQQAQQFATTLANPLAGEEQAIETAIKGLNGRQPDAALQQRITNFQNRQNQAAQQIQSRQNMLRSTEAHVNQQIGDRVGPIIEAIRAQRGATVVLAKNATLANDNGIDVTNDVLTQLNQQLPSVNVTPLPQQQQPAPAQPQQPRPQGR